MAKQLSKKVNIWVNGEQVENTISSIRAHIKKLTHQQNLLTIGTEEYVSKAKDIQQLQGILDANKKAIQSNGKAWEASLRRMSDVAEIIQSVQSVFQMADAAVGNIKTLVADAAALDDVYADVMKTTGLTKEQVLSLNKTLKKLDTRTATTQLNTLAYEAGKLGISSEELVAQFVSAADKINIALGDVLGEGAMVTIGKLADVYKQSTQQLAEKNLEGQMLAFGSAINKLGQSSTANEAYLVDFTARLGGIATQAGLSASEVLGFAAALDQDMQKVEMSATAFQKLIQTMISKPAEFAQIAGMSIEKFNHLIRSDMNTAIMEVLKSFKGKGGFADLELIFQDLGLDGARAAAAISSMANSINEIKTAQSIANDELTTGISVVDEFNVKNNTLQAQQEKARKQFEATRVELGQQLYPIIIHLTKTSTSGIKLLNEIITLFKEDKVTMSAMMVTITALSAAMLKSQVIKAKDIVISKSQNVLRKAEEIQLKINTAQEARRTASIEANRLATIKQQIALNKKILADRSEYISMGHMSLVMTAERNLRFLSTQATKQATIAEIAHTTAVKARNAVLKSTPWGFVIAGISAVMIGINKLVKSTNKWKLHKTVKDAANEFGTAQGKLQLLFDALHKASVGTDEYKSALSKLKELHPTLIQQWIDEKGQINDLEGAYKSLSTAVRDSVFQRVKDSKISSAYAENAENAMNLLTKFHRIVNKHSGSAGKANIANASVDDWVNKVLESGYFDDNNSISLYQDLKIAGLNDFHSARITQDLKILAGQIKKTKELEAELNKALPTTIIEQSSEPTITTTTEEEPEPMSTMGSIEESAISTKRTLEDCRRIINELNSTELKGTALLFSEIDTKVNDAKKSLLSSYNTANPQNLPKESRDIYLNLDIAGENAKLNKLREYSTKASDALRKLDETLSPQSDNKYLNEVTEATKELNKAILEIDSSVQQLSSDRNFLLDEANELNASDPFRETILAEIENIDTLIGKYKELKSIAITNAFNNVKTSDHSTEKPHLTETNTIIENDKLSWMLDESYADNIDSIVKKYQGLRNEISYAKIAEEEIINVLHKKKEVATNDTEKQAIDAEIQKHKEKVKELDAEANSLDKVEKKAIDVARGESLSQTLQKWTSLIQQFSDSILDVFSSINSLMDNIAKKELQHEEEIKDKQLKDLNDRLDKGVIAQEDYESEKLRIEKQYEEKEKAMLLEQWKRNKALSISQATMASALAIIQTWADWSLPTAAKIAMSAVVAANAALQIATIANEPKPYAKGGYVERKTYYMAGEAGSEWVASNKLLKDKKTAPIIEALEQYQRGNVDIFSRLPFTTMNIAPAQEAVNNSTQLEDFGIKTTPQTVHLLHNILDALKDPKYRYAILSKKTQEDFENNENFLRNNAKL